MSTMAFGWLEGGKGKAEGALNLDTKSCEPLTKGLRNYVTRIIVNILAPSF